MKMSCRENSPILLPPHINENNQIRRPKSVELFAAKAAHTLGLGRACDSLFRRHSGYHETNFDIGQQRPSTWGPTETVDLICPLQKLPSETRRDDVNNNATFMSFDSESSSNYDVKDDDSDSLSDMIPCVNEDNRTQDSLLKEHIIAEAPILTFDEILLVNSPPSSPPLFVEPSQGSRFPIGATLSPSNIVDENVESEVEEVLKAVVAKVLEMIDVDESIDKIRHSLVKYDDICKNNSDKETDQYDSMDGDNNIADGNIAEIKDAPRKHQITSFADDTTLESDCVLLAVHKSILTTSHKVGFVKSVNTMIESFDVASVNDPKPKVVFQPNDPEGETQIKDNGKHLEYIPGSKDSCITTEPQNCAISDITPPCKTKGPIASSQLLEYRLPPTELDDILRENDVEHSNAFKPDFEEPINIENVDQVENSTLNQHSNDEQVLFELMSNLLNQVEMVSDNVEVIIDKDLPIHKNQQGIHDKITENEIVKFIENVINVEDKTSNSHIDIDDIRVKDDDSLTPGEKVFDKQIGSEEEYVFGGCSEDESTDEARVGMNGEDLFDSMEKCLESNEKFTDVSKADLLMNETSQLQRPSDLFIDIPPSPHLRRTAFKLPNLDGLATPHEEVDAFAADVFSEETDELLERASIWRRQDSFAGPSFLKQKVQMQTYEIDLDFSPSPDHKEQTTQIENTMTNYKEPTPPPVDRSTKPKRVVIEELVQVKSVGDFKNNPPDIFSLPINIPPPLPLPPKPMKETDLNDGKFEIKNIQRNSALSRGSATSTETVIVEEEDIRARRTTFQSTSSSEGHHEFPDESPVDVQNKMIKDIPAIQLSGTRQASLPETELNSDEHQLPLRNSASEENLLLQDPSYNFVHFPLRSSASSPISSLSSSPAVSPLLRHKKRRNRVYHVPLRDTEDEHVDAEQQALEACNWLQAAGFPQYASLYEEGSFPLDVEMVSKDHDFLEEELIEPLKRRLAILNKCASMKLNNRISMDHGSQTEDEEEEQIPFAISERWHCDDSNRWSRNNDDNQQENANVESRENIKVYQRTISVDTSSSRETLTKRNKGVDSDGSKNTSSTNKLKLKPSILKKVGDLKKLRTPSFRRNAKETSSYRRDKSRDIVIGEPELQTGHEKLGQFRCVPITDSNSDVLMSLQQQHLKKTYTRPRKNSSQSLTSTSSSSAGGSSAASTPATRSRSFREKKSSHKRGRSVDAALRDPTSPILMNNKQLLKSQAGGGVQKLTPSDPEHKVFIVPKSHTPGTFPTTMSEVNEEENSSGESDLPLVNTKPQKRRLHKVKQRSISDFVGSHHRLPRPVSIYDNITESNLHPAASAQDLLDILTPPSPTNSDVTDAPLPLQSSDAFWSVDDIMKQTESLKQRVSAWDEKENLVNNRHRLNSADFTTVQTSEESRTVSPLSASIENLYESQDGLNDDTKSTTTHISRVEWMGHRQPLASVNSDQLQLHNLSVGQLMILSRLSFIKLTATMEKYGPVVGSKSNNLSWTVPRFIRKAKVPAYKGKDVFSVPLVHNVQKYGHPIPYCILNAMAYLHNEAMDQVGLFRKSGVKSRIQKIRNMCEKDPYLSNFDIEDVNAYDVADMVKQYFRDLPDHLMTTKLSETFIGIFLYVPVHLRLQSLHTAIMLLPDENREALKTLLCFLRSVADRSEENQMNESNLAVCFAPSIFYQHSPFSLSASNPPKGRKSSRHGNMLALGKPDSKEMNENNAANLCLAFMIQRVKELFTIPEDAMTHCRLSVMQQTQDVLASELGYQMWDNHQSEFLRDYRTYVNKMIAQTVRDENRLSGNKTKDWNFLSTENGTELCYKKINDGNPLRMWRCKVEIDGVTSDQVLRRVKNERHLWDDDLIEERVVEELEESTDCYQCLRAETRPHPPRDYCVMRSWSSNVSPRNFSIMVETSTEHPDAPLEEGVRGVVLNSQYIIECVTTTQSNSSDYTSSNSSLSSSGGPMQKCYLTRLCRVDTKGRNPEWYNKAFGFITLRGLTKIRDSFRVQNNNNFIPAKGK